MAGQILRLSTSKLKKIKPIGEEEKWLEFNYLVTFK